MQPELPEQGSPIHSVESVVEINFDDDVGGMAHIAVGPSWTVRTSDSHPSGAATPSCRGHRADLAYSV